MELNGLTLQELNDNRGYYRMQVEWMNTHLAHTPNDPVLLKSRAKYQFKLSETIAAMEKLKKSK